ncbi:MAG: hypothetical protein HC796_01125 [Synechococcaceae cyanobacterium RL_1_2]|nr:hypothetical protein [Synechococcaceae cyanobacterium RL_1_2]
MPPTDQDLLSQGMDSLMIMQVLTKLKQDLQIMVYPREVYENPQIDQLAPYLAQEFTAMHGQGATPATPEIQVSPAIVTSSLGVTQQTARSPEQTPLPPSVFVLSPPRAGSTLLRVMLAGHPNLFSPPELHLLPFNSMGQRSQELTGTYLDEGLQKAIMELMNLDADGSAAFLADLEARDVSIYDVYALLQREAGQRLVVDKSPTYALDRATLDRAETILPELNISISPAIPTP